MTKTPENIAAAASAAAGQAYDEKIKQLGTRPSWLPDFLAFDLDRDGIPDVLEPHLWSDAMAALLWAIRTFAPAESKAAQVAARVEEAVFSAYCLWLRDPAFAAKGWATQVFMSERVFRQRCQAVANG